MKKCGKLRNKQRYIFITLPLALVKKVMNSKLHSFEAIREATIQEIQEVEKCSELNTLLKNFVYKRINKFSSNFNLGVPVNSYNVWDKHGIINLCHDSSNTNYLLCKSMNGKYFSMNYSGD